MSVISAAIYTNNPSTNYVFTKPGADLLKPPDLADVSKLDFNVPRTAEDIERGRHKQDLPLSFFEVQEGDVEGGRLWYQNKFPKLSNEFAYLLARYNWGDLKYATKKSIRNDAKRVKKKTGKKPDIVGRFSKNDEPVVVMFET
jgi:hypothetical protein